MKRLLCSASGVGAALIAMLLCCELRAAEFARFYNLGEDDGDAEVGERASGTVDSVENEDDQAGALVDLFGFGTYTAGWTTESPHFDPELSEESPLAISFDGSNDWFDADAFDPRHFSGGFSALSQAWVKPDSAGEGLLQTVWALGTDNGGVSITEDGFWRLNSGGSAGNLVTESPVVFDEWVHVAVRRTGNNGFLYLNGGLVDTNAGFWNGTGPFALGASNPAGDNPFFGAIDEFVISEFGTTGFDAVADILWPDRVSGVLGDVDQDGDVDIDDYQIWSTNVGFDNGLGQGDVGTLLQGDVDENGRVNFFDFVVIRDEAAAAGVAVPEPGGLALCALAAVACLAWRARRLAPVGFAAVAAFVAAAPQAQAEIVVAEDFFYAQPTKAFGPGGGFSGQDYHGGQSGPAGSWTGEWGSVGDGVITGPDITEEGPFDPETDKFFGATRNGLSVNWLERDFQFDDSLDDGQSIYFGVTMRSKSEEAQPNSSFFLNDPGGEDQIGFGLTQGGFRAFLGEDGEGEDIPSIPGPGITDGLDPHRLIGRLDFNAAGDDERITVWLDPTDVETSEHQIEFERDVVTGLEELTGTLRLDHVASAGITLWDDLAVGTAWEDVVEVNVPRVTLQADPDTKDIRLTNTTGAMVELTFLQIESAAGFTQSRWDSLAEQGVEGWQENSPTNNRLTESNFSGALAWGDGAKIDIGRVFGRRADEDLIAHVGTADGMLNLANVVYGPIESDPLPGDANGDGTVDLIDFNILKENFGLDPATFEQGNFNEPEDTIVDLIDFNILKENFGASEGVPEPAAAMLLATAVIPALLRRRAASRR